MRHAPYATTRLAIALVLVLVMSTASLASERGRDVTVTRIGPEAAPFTVGYVRYVVVPGGCSIVDGETDASFGYNLGASYRAWVTWSLASIPDDAEIVLVEVEHYVWPPGDPYHVTQYRALADHPLAAPDCDALWGRLDGGVYSQYYTGVSEGWHRTTLGGTASANAAYRLTHGDWFGVAVTAVAEPTGVAVFPGWSAGGPDLIVTWSGENPVDEGSWAAVKSLYR